MVHKTSIQKSFEMMWSQKSLLVSCRFIIRNKKRYVIEKLMLILLYYLTHFKASIGSKSIAGKKWKLSAAITKAVNFMNSILRNKRALEKLELILSYVNKSSELLYVFPRFYVGWNYGKKIKERKSIMLRIRG